MTEQEIIDLIREFREEFACKVCGATPDENNAVEHGRGCYVESEDGGGTSFEDNTDEAAIRWLLARQSKEAVDK